MLKYDIRVRNKLLYHCYAWAYRLHMNCTKYWPNRPSDLDVGTIVAWDTTYTTWDDALQEEMTSSVCFHCTIRFFMSMGKLKGTYNRLLRLGLYILTVWLMLLRGSNEIFHCWQSRSKNWTPCCNTVILCSHSQALCHDTKQGCQHITTIEELYVFYVPRMLLQILGICTRWTIAITQKVVSKRRMG